MANWNGLVMTEKGIALQSKVQAGEVLNITKLKLGSGTLPEETDIRKLTDLIKPEQNLGIGGREPNGDYCKISATISNVGLEAGYYVRELGVFAQDPDDGEILYAYTTDGAPDYLPAEGGSTVISQEFSVNIAVSDTDKINVEIDPGALATMGYVQLQLEEHNEDAAAHEPAFNQHNTNETAHYDMTGATSSKEGKRGFVPAPKAGDQNRALFGNGQYQRVVLPTDIMSGATSSAAGESGLVPAPKAGDNKSVLFGDGTYRQVIETINNQKPDANNNLDLITGLNVLSRNKVYKIGDIAYSPKLPSWAYLSCVTAGTTAASEPSFVDVTAMGKYITDGSVKWIVDDIRFNVPVGVPFYDSYLHAGCVKLNGATVNRADYVRPAKIATDNNLWTDNPTNEPYKYGNGNGSTTMVLPDYRNRVIQGGDNLAVIAPGLPNVLLYIGKTEYYNPFPPNTVILDKDRQPGRTFQEMAWEEDTLAYQSISLQLGNPIYGASNTVQPPAMVLIPQIKY